MAQAKAAKESADRAYAKEKERYERYQSQLEKCKISCAAGWHGRVCHRGRPLESRFGSIAEGAFVRERQEILSIPNLSRMQVNTAVHESVLDQVKLGLKAVVRVDAFAERTYQGTVKTVAVLPDQGGWLASDTKVYKTIVMIDEDVTQLKPGMTAVVEIDIEKLTNVLSVPEQAIVQRAEKNWCYVRVRRPDCATRNPIWERRTTSLSKSTGTAGRRRDGIESDSRLVDERNRPGRRRNARTRSPDDGQEKRLTIRLGLGTPETGTPDRHRPDTGGYIACRHAGRGAAPTAKTRPDQRRAGRSGGRRPDRPKRHGPLKSLRSRHALARPIPMLWITLQLGVRNLMLHKLRSFLTMLGTILGVGSVIAMLAIGEGSKRKAVEQIRQLGATNVIIRSIKPEPENDSETTSSSAAQQTSRVLEYGLKYRDFERLEAMIPTVVRALPISQLRKDAQHGRRRIANARILGTTPLCPMVKNLRVRRGRFLTDTDLRITANVCASWGRVRPTGCSATKIHSARICCWGPPRTESWACWTSTPVTWGMAALSNQDNFNNDIYIPLTAARRRFGELQLIVRAGSVEFERTQLSEITLTVHDEKLVSQTAAMARAILEKSHTRGNDYEVQVPLELLRQAEQEKRIWNLVLGSIAGIALLVGGIGIMNIMLATVTERTREIGIRRALGARRRDITSQFLVETTVLSSTGGLLGNSGRGLDSDGRDGHVRNRNGVKLVVDLPGIRHFSGDRHHVRHVSGATGRHDGSY